MSKENNTFIWKHVKIPDAILSINKKLSKLLNCNINSIKEESRSDNNGTRINRLTISVDKIDLDRLKKFTKNIQCDYYICSIKPESLFSIIITIDMYTEGKTLWT